MVSATREIGANSSTQKRLCIYLNVPLYEPLTGRPAPRRVPKPNATEPDSIEMDVMLAEVRFLADAFRAAGHDCVTVGSDVFSQSFRFVSLRNDPGGLGVVFRWREIAPSIQGQDQGKSC